MRNKHLKIKIMEITKDNHKVIKVAEIATSTSFQLGMINSMVNSFLHDLHGKNMAGEEIVKAMELLRNELSKAPSINEMIQKA